MGQPFEVEWSDGDEPFGVARTDQYTDEVGGQDLPAGRSGTEPGSLDDRRAVDVVAFEGDVAEREP